VIVSDKLLTQLYFLGFEHLSSKLMMRVRFPPPAPERSDTAPPARLPGTCDTGCLLAVTDLL